MSRIPFPIYTPSHYTRKLYKTLPIYTPLLHTFKLCTPFTIYILLHHINKSFTQIPIHNWPLKNPLHHTGNPIVSPPVHVLAFIVGVLLSNSTDCIIVEFHAVPLIVLYRRNNSRTYCCRFSEITMFFIFQWKEFENTKGAIRIRKLKKGRHHNVQNEKG
jgi:hypothetical protein